MDITEVPRKQAKGKKKSSKTSRNESREQDHVAESQAKDPAPQEPLLPMLPPTFSLSEIKNKQRRHEMFMKLKQEKRKAPPKEVPKTIENQRVYDETTVDPDDEE
ncbi:hypothetical protein CRUP_005627, partial [Coryphaenoides rupestris]